MGKKRIIRTLKKQPTRLTLTPEQQEAKETLMPLIEAGEMCALTGYAGTGKTTLTADLIETLRRVGKPVLACTPTHKAAEVLRSKLGRFSTEVATIHSLLGLKLARNGQGGYELRSDGASSLPSHGVIVVDEASMIGQELWTGIQLHPWLTWVFVGDPAQLPPVGEEPSPVFDLPGYSLTSIVRQAQENPILEFATRIRHGDFRVMSGYEDGIGIGWTRDPLKWTKSAVKACAENPKETRLLAYRNRVVAHNNRLIRHHIFGKGVPRFVPDDRLMAQESYFEGQTPILRNSTEVTVRKAKEKTLKTWEGETWRIWQLSVHDGEREQQVPVLHEHEETRYEDELTKRRTAAVKKEAPWRDYYNLRECFAQVDYAYAMTVHKAQGSTFETVYVDWRDLWAAVPEDRQALMYVAATRPSKRLALLV